MLLIYMIYLGAQQDSNLRLPPCELLKLHTLINLAIGNKATDKAKQSVATLIGPELDPQLDPRGSA
jgi:hypothetical protein